MDIFNVGILPQHYTASQPGKWRQHGTLKRWYPTTTNTTRRHNPEDLDLKYYWPQNSYIQMVGATVAQ
jgi:hypothetical protein